MAISPRFRWLGAAGVALEAGDQTLAIDPFLSRPPFWQLPLGRAYCDVDAVRRWLRRCHYILITHSHYDHAMDVPEIARQTGARVIGSANTCALAAACGVPPTTMQEIHAGDRLSLGHFSITAMSAEHVHFPGWRLFTGAIPSHRRAPLRLRDFRMDTCLAYHIEVNGYRLLHSPGPVVKEGKPVEVLFVGPYGSLDAYDNLCRQTLPRLIILIHWDDFGRSLLRPLRPMVNKPLWAWPPLRRLDLKAIAEMIERAAPQTPLLVPQIFRDYNVANLLSSPERP